VSITAPIFGAGERRSVEQRQGVQTACRRPAGESVGVEGSNMLRLVPYRRFAGANNKVSGTNPDLFRWFESSSGHSLDLQGNSATVATGAGAFPAAGTRIAAVRFTGDGASSGRSESPACRLAGERRSTGSCLRYLQPRGRTLTLIAANGMWLWTTGLRLGHARVLARTVAGASSLFFSPPRGSSHTW
jgi:hypothetical protein